MNRLTLRRLFFAALCFSGLATVSPRAQAFALEGASWPAGSVITFNMQLGSPSQPLQDGNSTWDAAAGPAADAWNAVMNTVQIEKVLNASASQASGDHVNSVFFSSTISGDSFGDGVLAVTTYFSQNGKIVEADVDFNKNQSFDSYRGNLHFGSDGLAIVDIRRVLLHELGHALGLDHPDQNGQHVAAIMNSVVSDTYLLTADDIAGVQSLYGVPPPPPSPTPTPAPGPTPTPPPNSPPGHLVNLSTRMRVGVGDDVLIGGFIVQGQKKKKVLLRALGPSLGESGVVGALQDPQMTLIDASGKIIETNDNWQDGPDAADVIASTIPPTDPRESAIVARLAPGDYTVVVSGVNGTSGIGLVENYALDTDESSSIANISTRGLVGAGEEVLIGGFIIDGTARKNILVRALGPSLGGSSRSAVLANPLVELRDGNGDMVAQNDDWQSGSEAAAIRATGIPPTDSREAALITALGPGNYTAVVRGADGGEGVGLIEIYDLDL